MATFNKFNAFVEAVAEKVHNLGSDQLRLALTNTAPTSAGAILTDITEISYTNCSSRDLTTSGSIQVSGTYKLSITDKVLTASAGNVGPFRYVVLYNSTAASGNLIGWYDYGSSITLADTETLTVNFDDANGVLTIA
jgi:hypothetical protein